MDNNIIKEFEESTTGLFQILSSFTNEQFNRVPFEGSWTAGQVAEHLFKSESNAVNAISGNTQPTTDRNPDANEKAIRSSFLNFEIKFQSPDFILPSDEPKDKEEFLKRFENTREGIRQVVKTEDLTLTCTDFSLPGLGEVTRYEWVCFVICHSKRHTHQLKNIHDKLLRGRIN